MYLQQAKRKNVKIKLGLQGASGAGKSISALFIAKGITNDWSKIAVIDTENNSSSLYAHLGNFNVLNLTPPFSPERYIEAIKVCLDAGIEVIIIDSISMEWEYILENHSNLAGNSYTNWSKFTPRHQQFIQAILQADAHIICTIRAKQDYVLNEKNGKQIPEKVGMKPIQRDGVDYEFTLLFELDIKNNATTSKDRTGLFMNKPEFKITTETGKIIAEWCNQGEANENITPTLSELINACNTIEELRELYLSSTNEQQTEFRNEFNRKKYLLQTPTNQIVTPQNLSKNGTSNNTTH